MFAIKDIVEGVTKSGLDKLVEEIEKPKLIVDEKSTKADSDEFAAIVAKRLQNPDTNPDR